MMVDDLSPEVGVVLKMSWDIQYIVELLGKFGNDQRNGLSVWVNSLLESNVGHGSLANVNQRQECIRAKRPTTWQCMWYGDPSR